MTLDEGTSAGFKCQLQFSPQYMKLNQRHFRDGKVNLIDDLYRIEKIGVKQWLSGQEKEWACPKCKGNICITDKECYDCGYEID